jgi:hypothetical protein
MKILETLTGLFKPAADLVDNLHTSEEERAQIKTAMLGVQINAALQFLDYEKQLMTNQTNIIIAEAQGGSWIQRNWRPITMLTFLFLVVMDSFGWLPFRLADQAWTLLQLGLSGYVVGRSAEKIVPKMFAPKQIEQLDFRSERKKRKDRKDEAADEE